ncbi:MAG: type VI secretion system protein ImpL [Desulfobacter sp.]|nr:MAG: type VI secretion system protein ImpL [Desulfobacter sp.]
MKKRFALVFKIFLVLALLGLVGIAVFAAVVWAKWPLWVCAFILIGLAGILLGAFFIYKLLLRKKEQKFVSQIIEQDNAALKKKSKKEQALSREMQAKWKEAMDSLKKSHLKKQGNPLYVLPWYLIIGKSGTGKTTAIKSANLSSSFSEVKSVSGISGTRNCDWWFFEQAILIDTAGRYAVPVDQDKDRDEWQKFLGLLAKYRKKEPLNGLIVTVSADFLNNAPAQDQEEYGRDIRSRVDELMRVLDAKFPIYVMVTKCDLIQGMTQFCKGLDEDALGQAMGMVNPGLEKNAGTLLGECFKTVGERIRDIRLLILQKARETSPELMLFPDELEKIKPGLELFVNSLFQENPYQETPFFRGIFFSSGRQEGTPFSHFLKDMGLIGEAQVLPGTSRGLFLHDFFTRLLPSDRGMFTKTMRGAAWARLTRNLGFAAWTTIILAVCGILSFSFVKNLHTIKTASAKFSGPQILQGELISDVSTLEQFRAAIKKIETSNGNWWIPRLGLHESIHVEEKLKKKYCTLMEKRFLDPLDKQMADQMAGFSAVTPVAQSIPYIEHLVKRITVIKAKLVQRPIEELRQMKQPRFNTVAIGARQDIAEEVRIKMNDLYLHYLLWQQDTLAMNQRMNGLQKWLARLISMKGATLKWVVDRANSDPDLSGYSLGHFWGNIPEEESSPKVAPAFTLDGKTSIDQFIAEIENALTDPLVMAGLKREFYIWYRAAYLESWISFVSQFGTGLEMMNSREDWQAVSTHAGNKSGPYFSLLHLIPGQVAPFAEGGNLPGWAVLVADINQLHNQAGVLRAQKAGSTGMLGQAAKKIKSKLAPGLDSSSRMDAEAMLKAAKSFMAYQDSMAMLIASTASQRAAFELATQLYTEDPATSDTAFFKARREFKKLKRMVPAKGDASSAVWELVEGPLNFYHEFAMKEAACELQKKWENNVLVEMRDVSDDANINTMLLGPEGFVTRFIKGPCHPFIKRGLKKGFYPKKLDGKTMALRPYFFKFLTRGVSVSKPAKSNYSVKISGLPTSANDTARVQPHATRLELICADKTTLLENLNYPVRKVFSWAPDSECEVSFSIHVGSLELNKRYTGRLSFPKFLKDFPKGQHSFVPANFPDDQDDLKRMGIKFIKVRYRFSNHEPVAGLVSATPGKTPMEITRCWE